ncbi:MAG: aminotransferase class I/II-fold pyridoxal phosphate-dependent enzyme [Rectinemataceae bacterium]|jgi:aspartate/methionine/tyrosine aminotransferase
MPVRLTDLSLTVLDTQYAVRGPIVARAAELEKAGRRILYGNIGNPQALGQKPLTYIRQTLALCEYPALLDSPAARGPGALFPPDVVEAARTVLEGTQYGLGAYSESKGVQTIREAVARFISERDGVDSDPDSIFLGDGASKTVQLALRTLISGSADGIMVPIPQYPLYSATITLYGGRQVPYYLDEDHDWCLSREHLDQAFLDAMRQGIKVKAICVLNPGNPTGSVLDHENIAMIIDFARSHDLAILTDEVYQEDVYLTDFSFYSFAKVMAEMGVSDVSLFSFHSCSKGFIGECGHRGGYMEIRNVPGEVVDQIAKLQSISLCSNLPGQVVTYCMVTPPAEGSPSRELYVAERDHIMSELRARAAILAAGLNGIPGIHCTRIAGAMYAFPRISLPADRTDDAYCLDLLEATGICVVPGSGFGQMPGTHHFRTTILPETALIYDFVEKLGEFQASYK